MSLYTAESRRLVKRRFTRYFVLGLLVVLAAIAVAMFVTNQKTGPAQIADAKAKAHAEYQRNVDQVAALRRPARRRTVRRTPSSTRPTATRSPRRARATSIRPGTRRPPSTSGRTSPTW